MSECFRHWQNKSLSNTIVKYDDKWRITRMFLHWNEIATLDDMGVLKLDNCGWETNTTKERLNWILEIFDLWHIFQKNYEWFYMNKNWKVVPMNEEITLSIYDN